jgi:hypothetical protein
MFCFCQFVITVQLTCAVAIRQILSPVLQTAEDFFFPDVAVPHEEELEQIVVLLFVRHLG